MSEHAVIVALGSNLPNTLGSSEVILSWAVTALQLAGTVSDVAALYRSIPVGPSDQPDFLNSAVRLFTRLSPAQLLVFLQQLEQQAGRTRLRHWGERTLDLDIIFYGQQHICEPHLTVPHVQWTRRGFVVQPLRDLAVPEAGIPALDSVAASGLQRIEGPDWWRKWQQFDVAIQHQRLSTLLPGAL